MREEKNFVVMLILLVAVIATFMLALPRAIDHEVVKAQGYWTEVK